MLVILATQEAEIRRDRRSKPAQANSSRDCLKKLFTKTGLMEWLKVKALSSSPSTAKKKRKKGNPQKKQPCHYPDFDFWLQNCERTLFCYFKPPRKLKHCLSTTVGRPGSVLPP
jgi:hypothetical protein